MARNGSGTYTNPFPDFVANTVISSTEVDTNNAQMAAALTASIANDGQTPILANLPMSGFKHTGVTATSGTNPAEYMARDYWLTQRYMDNVIVCPSGEVNQMGTTSTADDAYGGPDGWYTLVQTGAVSVAQGTNLENTSPFYERVTQSQASAQRMGRAQIIESANCRHMRGQSIVLSFTAQMSTSTNLRYAILEWTSTADSVTSDIVNDWTSSTYTAGNFFISSNVNVLAVGVTALTANTPATVTALAATVGSSMNNLIVFYWTESTAAQNVTLDRAKASLKLGAAATPFYPRLLNDELSLCRRYLYQIKNGGSQAQMPCTGVLTATTDARLIFTLPVPMRTSPTLSVSAAANFDIRGAAVAATSAFALTVYQSQSSAANVTVTCGALTAGNGCELLADANEWIRFDARL